MAENTWETIEFSVDLINGAMQLLTFLKDIHELGSKLNSDEALILKTLYRYEKYWLPMSAKNPAEISQLYPPLDVAWLWHCHPLNTKKTASVFTRLKLITMLA